MRTKHGHHKNYKPSATYVSWQHMKARCDDPGHHAYPSYGGRGIKYDPRWSEFAAFLVDMGSRPDGMSLDRRDTNADYTKDNCRWATPKEQAGNRRKPKPPKLSEQDKHDIREMLRQGFAPSSLALGYGVTEARISQVKHGR